MQEESHKPLCRLVSRADNFSSAERGENAEKNKSWGERKKTHVFSVFSEVELSQNEGMNEKIEYFPLPF
jgi:hypothetical protein